MIRTVPINPDYYFTVAVKSSRELKIKGSRFITTLAGTATKETAEKFIGNIRKNFHDATHNCFAYRIDETTYRYSDDGEPSGTAGKPIFAVLKKYKLMNSVLVVTRYFGGTRLGTGGLIRAYRTSAESAISEARIVKKYNYLLLQLEYPFSMINKVQHLVHEYGGIIEQDSHMKGIVARVQIIPSKLQKFRDQLLELTSAQVVIKNVNGNQVN